MDDSFTLNRRARLRELIAAHFEEKTKLLLDHIEHRTGKRPNQGAMSALQQDNSVRSFGEKKGRSLAAEIGLHERWFELAPGTNLQRDEWTKSPSLEQFPQAPEQPAFATGRVRSGWPFKRIKQSEIDGLDGDELKHLEGAMDLVLARISADRKTGRPKAKAPITRLEDVRSPFGPGPAPEQTSPRIPPARPAVQGRRPLRLSRNADVIAPPGTDADNDYVAVPTLPIRPAAGPAREHFYERPYGSMLMSRQFLESFKLPIERMKILHAEGNSMQPDIPDGAPMLYFEDDIARLATIDKERAYVINYGGEIMVKMIAKGIAGNWVARSINQEYGDIALERDDGVETRVLGYVLWTPPADPLEFS